MSSVNNVAAAGRADSWGANSDIVAAGISETAGGDVGASSDDGVDVSLESLVSALVDNSRLAESDALVDSDASGNIESSLLGGVGSLDVGLLLSLASLTLDF